MSYEKIAKQELSWIWKATHTIKLWFNILTFSRYPHLVGLASELSKSEA